MGGNCNVFLGWSTFSLTVTLIRNNIVWIYRVMELKATTLGKRLAQHPYDRAVILNAGIKVSGDRHEYLIPFNQLLAIHCKRGLVWGELEFVLPDEKVVRLHGTEWGETQRFHRHLDAHWRRWSEEMSEIAAGVLQQQLILSPHAPTIING